MKALTLALASLFVAAPAAAQDVVSDSVVATRSDDGTIRAVAAPNLTPATQYYAGSIAKWACSVTALRLEKQGVLSLDESVAELLPSYRGAGRRSITLRHLLSNRAGLVDGLMPAIRDDIAAVLALDIDAAAAANRFASGDPVAAPGTAWSYDLVNWILVQAILEHRADAPIAAILDRQLFGPEAADLPATLIATRSLILDDAPTVSGEVLPAPGWLACAGGMVTTPVDLVRLLEWVYGEALDEDQVEQLFAVTTPEEGYTLGGRVWLDEDHQLVWLSGSDGAFKSRAAYDTKSGRAFAAMTASDDYDRLEKARTAWVEQR